MEYSEFKIFAVAALITFTLPQVASAQQGWQQDYQNGRPIQGTRTPAPSTEPTSNQPLSYTAAEMHLNLEAMKGKLNQESNVGSAASAYVRYVEKAPVMKDETPGIVAVEMAKYYTQRVECQGAVQACEAAESSMLRLMTLQIAQNKRIIELLEQIAKK